MTNATPYYPAAPVSVRPLHPSPAFKKEVMKVTGAIILFFIVYLVLLAAAVLLAVACFYLAIMVFGAFSGTLTLIVGLGLLALGGSVLFFLIKFIFARTKQDNDNRIEITEAEQPQLFAFIRRLTKDTGTRFPQKIFVSSSVNAAVFYNSSFWSMFFPIRKNLEIGLGLVNTVNLSEFKAVMAHEFGHFSQKSMKLGSFTYNVNHIIYNMLYENNSYERFLGGWSRIHSILSLFALITVNIARGIQNVLRGMYGFVNKQYLGLSRQMEFNADAIAASVAGGNNLITALHRIEMSDTCYQEALGRAETFLKEKKVSRNIFHNQRAVMFHTAGELQLPQQDGLPVITQQFLSAFSKPRINFKNQWASHPTNEERQAELAVLDMPAEPDTHSAWVLFANAEALQQQLTNHLYRHVADAGKMQPYDEAFFEQQYAEETERYRLPAAFKQYYSRRYADVNDWALDEAPAFNNEGTLNELVNGTLNGLPERIRSNETDRETAASISEKKIDIKTFDFDGDKYSAASAGDIAEQLDKEIIAEKEKLAAADKDLYADFYHRAINSNPEAAIRLQQDYLTYQFISRQAMAFSEAAGEVINVMRPFYSETNTLEAVQAGVNVLKRSSEINLKAKLTELMANDFIHDALPAKTKEDISEFLSSRYSYFVNSKFMNSELDSLYGICTGVGNELNEVRFAAYKKMLVTQAALLN